MSEQATGNQQDNLIGKTLGQFEILEEIGRGGMATVYRARQRNLNRIVAVKVLPRTLLHDPAFYERFEREVDVIAHLEHPHILPIFDYGEAEGVPYIAMRYLAGGSLSQWVRHGPVPLERLEKPLMQIASALDHAHHQGIIHRDLKPGNILLDEEGNAYLSDFGIARVLDSNLTGSAIIGTPAYMSPEQASGQPLDSRSDIYALGVVLFELITGREPYQAETPVAVLLKHINEPMPPVRQFRPDVPAAVEVVIAKATEKDPNERYASATEMAQAFSEALRTKATPPAPHAIEDAPTLAPSAAPTPVTPVSPVPPPDAVVGTAQMPDTEVQPQAGRQSGILIAALVVIALALAGVAAVLVLPNLAVPTPVPLRTPTPFPGAVLASQGPYTLAVPADWAESDLSDEVRTAHVWRAGDGTASVTLSLINLSANTTSDFQAAIEAYHERYYQSQMDVLAPIDEETAPNGTLRRSYRLVGPTDPPSPPGQIDVFYLQRAPYLVVLEVYSADSTGNTLVPTFQMILDSLQMHTDTQAG